MDPDPDARPGSDPGASPAPSGSPHELVPDPARTVIIEAMGARLDRPARPSAGHPARLVLLPAVSGMDTATLTAGLGLALASVGPDDVVLADLDVAPRGTGLAMRFGLYAPQPGARMPVAPRLTYRRTGAAELDGAWPGCFGLVLVHCGPGPSRDVLDRALAGAGTVLLAAPDTDVGIGSACAALDWFRDGLGGGVAERVVVLLAGPDGAADTRTAEPLAARCRAVRRLSADVHSAAPGVFDPDLIPGAALDALLDLAREVGR